MDITKHKVVTVEYSLRDETGRVLESADEATPFRYLHGSGFGKTPGLEPALEGKTVGDRFTAVIAPLDAYGERDESLVTAIPRTRFVDRDVQIGMRFRSESGIPPRTLTVIAVDAETVTVDGNHPLAGHTLSFIVAILSVREATPAEISKGRVDYSRLDRS